LKRFSRRFRRFAQIWFYTSANFCEISGKKNLFFDLQYFSKFAADIFWEKFLFYLTPTPLPGERG
jgi:hypothetical protein